jgi:hypothetical protein
MEDEIDKLADKLYSLRDYPKRTRGRQRQLFEFCKKAEQKRKQTRNRGATGKLLRLMTYARPATRTRRQEFPSNFFEVPLGPL